MDDLNGTDDRRLNSCSSAADTQNSSASVLPTNSFPTDDFPARRSLVCSARAVTPQASIASTPERMRISQIDRIAANRLPRKRLVQR